MLKILCVCINGLGSSLIFKTKVDKVCKKLGTPAQIVHQSLSECRGSAGRYDVVCCSRALEKNFDRLDPEKTKLITVVNIMSESEIEQAFLRQNVGGCAGSNAGPEPEGGAG